MEEQTTDTTRNPPRRKLPPFFLTKTCERTKKGHGLLAQGIEREL